jgi:hypothetical protein
MADPIISAPFELSPAIREPWRALPDVGFEYDIVLAVSRKPYPVVAPIVRGLAMAPHISDSRIFSKLHDKSRSSPRVLQRLSRIADQIKQDFGHAFFMVRHNAEPRELVQGEAMRVVGFYPSYLAKRLRNGVLQDYDTSLSDQDRFLTVLRYDKPATGVISDDRDGTIDYFAIMKIDYNQYQAAPAALAKVADGRPYHAWGREGLNCTGLFFEVARELGVRTHPGFEHSLPYRLAQFIGDNAGRIETAPRANVTPVHYGVVTERINPGFGIRIAEAGANAWRRLAGDLTADAALRPPFNPGARPGSKLDR